MIITQLSVFLENKPGRLFDVTDALAESGIDISALYLPIQTSQFQSFPTCRGIHHDTAKTVPRGFTDREHGFNVCGHNLYLQNF